MPSTRRAVRARGDRVLHHFTLRPGDPRRRAGDAPWLRGEHRDLDVILRQNMLPIRTTPEVAGGQRAWRSARRPGMRQTRPSPLPCSANITVPTCFPCPINTFRQPRRARVLQLKSNLARFTLNASASDTGGCEQVFPSPRRRIGCRYPQKGESRIARCAVHIGRARRSSLFVRPASTNSLLPDAVVSFHREILSESAPVSLVLPPGLSAVRVPPERPSSPRQDAFRWNRISCAKVLSSRKCARLPYRRGRAKYTEDCRWTSPHR